MRSQAVIVSLVVLAFGCGDEPDADTPAPQPLAEVFVDAMAPAGGDGSFANPVRTLEEALAVDDVVLDASGARTIRVRPGQYDAPGVRVDGAIVRADTEGVVLGGADATWTFGRLVLENVTLDGGALSGEHLELRGVTFGADAASNAAVLAADGIRGSGFVWSIGGGEASVRDLRVEQSRLDVSASTFELDDAVLEGGDGPIVALHESDARVSDLRIEEAGLIDGEIVDLAERADRGAALLVDGGRLELSRYEAVRSAERGVNVRGAVVDGTDVVVRGGGVAAVGVQPRAEQGVGEARATVTFDSLEVSGGTTLLAVSASDVVVRDALLENGGAACVLASSGSRLELYDSTVLGCDNGHISLLGAETTGVIADNVVRGAGIESCIAVSGPRSDVVVRGNTVSECAGSGIASLGSAGLVIAENDVSAIEASPLFPDVNEGISLVQTDAVIRNNVVRDTAGAGIALLDSSGTLEANVVRDVGDVGIRIVAEGPGDTQVEGGSVERATGAALLVLESSATVRGVTLSETRFSAEFGAGMGAGASVGSSLTLEDCVLRENERYGVFVDGESTLSSSGNRYEDNGGFGIMCVGGAAVSREGDSFSGNEQGDAAAACGE